MSRIRVGDELAKLKDFQRRTVDSVFQRMYTDANPATRFLVADEVGLGKTLVARGLVARAIAHLKAENVERIDVIYVCSNAAIAQQNIQRLNVLGEQQVAFTTRLTLLPAKVHELAKNRVNFVSFTPNVALNVKSRSGTKEERVILYHLLSSRPGSKTALRNLLQATAGKDSWERSITDEASTLDSTLTNRFLTALANDAALCAQLDDGLARFARYREHPPWEDNDVRLAVIGNLRHALAKSCIDALEPDLVILDEFQRFSEILQGDDETSELARLLFEYPKVRVLLLSATPYKMLTLSGEDDEHDHFREFLGTARFLLRDESRVAELEAAMGEMRQGLRSIGNGGYERTREARDRAQAILRTVMSRMERVSGTAERDALVSEPQVDVSLRREDIAQSQLAQRLARTLGSPDIVEYWKSAPYLHWAAPILLDARFHGVAGWVQKAFAAIYDRDEDDEDDGDGENASGFEAHVNELSAVLRGDIELGTFPEDLSEVLADVALGSPAVCAARALRRLSPNLGPDEPAILTGAAHVARGFRSLFNVPETMSLLRAQSADPTAYWRETLRYCAEGDLQAVLDEYAHYLRDDLGLFAGDSEKRAEDVGRAIARALTLRTAAIVAHDVHAKDARVKIDELRLRSRFAVRYGSTRGEEAKSVDRADDVRRAFNSPFRPFVLASTSVGQEGLDFHPYCHAVVHWNLPSNPVDLEQREGRVHRYKGHAIRKNIARAYGLDALSRLWDEGDPWQRMFELALKDRPAGKNDLWPYWLFEVKDGFKVERRVPMLPLSREHAQLTRLKKSLALYRLTFGQPRQEDLLTWLEGQHDAGALTHEQVSDLRIRLEATGEPIPPNEDPDPETDVDAVVTSLRGGASETLLRQWTGTSAALAATASLFSAALDAIPEAAASVHWTLNQRRHALRLNLGQAEVLTLYDGTLTLVADGLSTESTQRLRDLDAAPKAIPYDRLRRISPRAKWITVGVENVAPLLDLLVPAIQSFLRLDTRTSRAHSRDLLSVEAVQTIGRLAGSSWATWKPSA